MTRPELIVALEAAPEGSRELDFWCWWYGRSTEADKPVPKPPGGEYVRDKMGYAWTFRPTSSLDAALSLYLHPPTRISTNPITVCVEALKARAGGAA